MDPYGIIEGHQCVMCGRNLASVNPLVYSECLIWICHEAEGLELTLQLTIEKDSTVETTVHGLLDSYVQDFISVLSNR